MCYGVFTANGTINITAGATIPLEARNMNSNCFSVSNGVITVLEPGLYLAILSVDTPSNAAVDTTIQRRVLCARRLQHSGNDFRGAERHRHGRPASRLADADPAAVNPSNAGGAIPPAILRTHASLFA